ncbi:MAG TPA: hemerythrin domain-containing protein [Myxococcaceae bacterium]|nr:hemerythrin domain-containing protein [Myxococcaceae bacterium]
MHTRVYALQEEHAQLRALLRQCESASPRELPATLRRLEEVFVPHRQAKVALYEDSVKACQARGDKASISMLSIFRSNLNVMADAVIAFLRSPDPQPERFLERFRTVAATLRSMMDSEEKVVFPICLRHAQPGKPS